MGVVRATTTSRWRNPRKLMVSADHSPGDDNDGSAQHGVTDDFQSLADGLGVGDGNRRRFGSRRLGAGCAGERQGEPGEGE